MPDDSPKLARITIQKTMPYMGMEELLATLHKCRHLLVPTGRVTLSFFGVEHSWVQERPDLHFHELRQIWRVVRMAGLAPDGGARIKKGPHTTEQGIYVPNWHEITQEAKPDIPVFARAPAWTINL